MGSTGSNGYKYVVSHNSHMANMTLSIPDELYSKMAKHPEYRWSEVARQAIEAQLKDAELLSDLKAIAKAEKELKAGKTIPLEKLAKKLGLEHEL
ncbi:Uncharacterised protein [uncultured archaeon]|nr:Uncharacterised protein [uncultured archaeon]